MNVNTGHGHVRPRPDGFRARCGGPGLCEVCSREARVAYQLIAGTGASTPAPTGWECPRCGVVHAPFVMRCACADRLDRSLAQDKDAPYG